MSDKQNSIKKILIIQTAFLGDVVLTIPMVQEIKSKYPDAVIDFLCIPSTSDLLRNNPGIRELIPYDKRNSGIRGLADIVKKIRNEKYDVVISPHRSFRSAAISFLSKADDTVSFDKSSFSFLYKTIIKYDTGIHEIQRNLRLLLPLGIDLHKIVRPELNISIQEKRKIDSIFYEHRIREDEKFLVIAPGTIWFTKRFPEQKFINLCNLLTGLDKRIFLIGSKDDKRISDFIVNNSRFRNFINLTGTLSVMESAELIRRSKLIITNDSAPMHIANSMNTDVCAIFGATVPEFGFYPYGKNDKIFQTENLRCRPCSIHGSAKCPIKTFVCMLKIDEKEIADFIKKKLS
ncbi:MAG: glycosyltransferase family 9 protein [Ignavibacteria bacterium]|nr:glycosyltransferase family 9 protein [Ignavibacteria bacterium]